MNKNIKVSVVIPVYNAAEYLQDCLDGLVNQTLKEFEIICVDAGSSDNSVEILQAYAEKDSRVIPIKDKGRLFAGAARNIGLSCAKGEYLFFLDADDFFETDMLEKSYCRAKATDADIVVFESDYYSELNKIYIPNYFTINRDLIKDRPVFSADEIEKNVFRVFTGWAWDKLFKAEFIRESNLTFQDLRTTNDMLFVFAAQILAQRIVVMDELLAHHRLTEHTLSVTREKSWHCFHEALIALKETLEAHNLYERYEQDYINYFVHFSLWHLKTLKNPAHDQLYAKLKDEWYDKAGVPSYPEKYFYNKKEYKEYRNIYTYDCGKTPFSEKMKHKMLTVFELLGKAFYVMRQKGVIAAAKWVVLMKIKIGK